MVANEPGKRRPSKNEAPPPTVIENVKAIPDKPDNLGPRGSLIWDDLVAKLANSKIICEYDGRLMAAYCYAAGEVEEYREYLINEGRFKKLSNNVKSPREEVKALKEAEDRFIKLSAQLGLSPASRKSLNIKIEVEGTGQTTDTISDLCG